jgi:hypothetical protein
VRRSAIFLVLGCSLIGLTAGAQYSEIPQKLDGAKSEPKYTGTFSGAIVEVSAERITVSRSILGKQPEKRSFWIKPDTRVEGKLHARVRVTVGFVTTDDGDLARLIVVRASAKPAPKK